MPGRDRTGPLGQGPLTGKRLGFCTGSQNTYSPDYYDYGFRRGLGRGFGRGFRQGLRGYGRGFWFNNYQRYSDEFNDFDKESEKKFLEDRIKYLENELSELKKNLQKINNNKKE